MPKSRSTATGRPVYKYLTALPAKPAGPGKITWNFEKFLVNRQGEVAARFAPRTKPDAPDVIAAIQAELDRKAAIQAELDRK